MATAFAWVEGSKATPAEKARDLDNDLPKTPTEGLIFGTLHTRGVREGQLYVSITVDIPEGTSYSDHYRLALDALLAADKRVRNGHAFTIGII